MLKNKIIDDVRVVNCKKRGGQMGEFLLRSETHFFYLFVHVPKSQRFFPIRILIGKNRWDLGTCTKR